MGIKNPADYEILEREGKHIVTNGSGNGAGRDAFFGVNVRDKSRCFQA